MYTLTHIHMYSTEDLKEDIITEAFLAKNENADLIRPYFEQYLQYSIDLIYKESLKYVLVDMYIHIHEYYTKIFF